MTRESLKNVAPTEVNEQELNRQQLQNIVQNCNRSNVSHQRVMAKIQIDIDMIKIHDE